MRITNAVLVRVIGLVVSILWIVLLSFALPVGSSEETGFSWHDFLIATRDGMYPFNVQVFMWVAFFFCLSEIFIKWLAMQEEIRWIKGFSLYQNPQTVTVYTSSGEVSLDLRPEEALKPEILAAIFYAKRKLVSPSSMIFSFFKKINHQFQSTNDVGDVYSALTSAIEMRLHQLDLSYTVIRYLVWLIPTLGFIGTVIGIALALGKAASLGAAEPTMLEQVIPMLATAFYTTLLALLLSAIVMILIQIVQAKDEELVNKVGTFCMDEIVAYLKPNSSRG